MKITATNYSKTVDRIGIENLPAELQQAHDFLKLSTNNFKDWRITGSDLQEVKNLAFEKLGEFVSNTELKGLDGFNESPESYYHALAEIHHMESFLESNNEILVKVTLRQFIEKLQQDIKEKRIRKFSPYSSTIRKIQKFAIDFYNQKTKAQKFVIPKKLVAAIERDIMDFHNRNYAHDKDDRFKPIELTGTPQQEQVLPSEKFTEMEFPSLGFNGKWLTLIGDPCRGFTMMVYALPKMGKSYLCIDFAGYLAQTFGKVLYIAKEEKFGKTLQQKIIDKKAEHENLFIGDNLPEDLSGFDFVFLDSVNSLGLKAEDLRKLKEDNPGKSFVYIFQSTKGGSFRGENPFMHDVDAIVHIPVRGKAVQYGRFNQGGEMQIFEDNRNDDLNGISKEGNTKKTAEISESHFLKLWTSKSSDEIVLILNSLGLQEGTHFTKGSINPLDFKKDIQHKIYKKLKSKKPAEPQITNVVEFESDLKIEEIPDDDNSAYIFTLTSTKLLCQALKGEFDLNYLVRKELANRGQDEDGKWVGFDKAKTIHKVAD